MQRYARPQTPPSAASQLRRAYATDRNRRELEKSSESAQTPPGLSQLLCQSSDQTVRLSAAKAATSTSDRSRRWVREYAAAAASVHSASENPKKRTPAST